MKSQESYFNRIPLDHTVEENWTHFKNFINEAMIKNIPQKLTSNRKQQTPWITRNIIRLSRRKQRAYNTHKRNKTTHNWEKFTALRSRIHRELRSSYWDYVKRLIDPAEDKTTKNFWKFVKSRKQDTIGIDSLRDQGRFIKIPRKKLPL